MHAPKPFDGAFGGFDQDHSTNVAQQNEEHPIIVGPFYHEKREQAVEAKQHSTANGKRKKPLQ